MIGAGEISEAADESASGSVSESKGSQMLAKLGQRGYVAHEDCGTCGTGGADSDTDPTPREDHDRQQDHPRNGAAATCRVGDARRRRPNHNPNRDLNPSRIRISASTSQNRKTSALHQGSAGLEKEPDVC